MKQYNQNPIFFKDSLFESVSFQPWSLEYKMMFTETRLMLEEALNEIYVYYSAQHRLFEADAESAEDIIKRFENLRELSPDDYEKLKAHVSKPKDVPPPGILNRFLNMIKKAIERLGKLSIFPDTEAKIQETVQKAMDKAQDKGWGKALNPVLRGLKNLADTMKGTWVPSLVLVVLGIATSLLAIPYIPGGLWLLSLIMILARIVADLVNGKTLTYAFTKAVALWGAGYGVAELGKYVMPMITSALSATPPTTLGTADVGAPGADARVSDAPYIPEPSPEAPPPAPTIQPPYAVRAGDTLGAIAQAKNVTVQALWDANRDIISDPNKISPRMTLKIPAANIIPGGPTNIWAGWRGGR